MKEEEKIVDAQEREKRRNAIEKARNLYGYMSPKAESGNTQGRAVIEAGKENGFKIYKDLGFHHDRAISMGNVFAFYLMAKKGMSVEEVMEVQPGTAWFDQYISEFKTFAEEHPVMDSADPTAPITDEQKKNIGEWTDIFTQSAEKFKEYKFPDIDYGNREEVRKHADVLMRVSGMQIDHSQEFEMLAHGGRGAIVDAHVGGKEKREEKMAPFLQVQPICFSLKRSYFPEDGDLANMGDESSGNYQRKIDEMAGNRLRFVVSTGQEIRGKTVGELVEGKGVRELYKPYEMVSGFSLDQNLLQGNEGKNYLLHRDVKLEEKFVKKQADVSRSAREKFNQSVYEEPSRGFLSNLDNMMAPGGNNDRKAREYLSAACAEKDINKKLELLNDPGLNKKISACFKGLFDSGDTLSLLKQAGYQDKYNMLRIDGVGAGEKFSSRYAGVNDIEQRELLIQADIVNEICNGKGEITVDQPLINEKNQIFMARPVSVTRSTEELGDRWAFYNEMKTLHRNLKEKLDSLISTQENPNANHYDKQRFEATEGSKEYQALVENLRKCVAHTDLDGMGAKVTYEQFKKNMKELTEASRTYVKTHSSLFKARRTNGKIRKGVAEDLSNELGYNMERLNDLHVGMTETFDPAYGKDMKSLLNLDYTRFRQQMEVRDIASDKREMQKLKEEAREREQRATRKGQLRKRVAATMADVKIEDIQSDGVKLELFDNVIETTHRQGRLLDCAKAVVARDYINRINGADVKMGYSLDRIGSNIEKDTFSDQFKKSVKNLAQNKAFIKLVNTEKPISECVREWEALVERNLEQKRKNFEEKIEQADHVLDHPEKYSVDNMVRAAAVVYTKHLVDAGKCPDYLAPLEMSKLYAEDPGFRHAINDPKNRNKMLPTDQIRERIADPVEMEKIIQTERKQINTVQRYKERQAEERQKEHIKKAGDEAMKNHFTRKP